MAGEVGQNENLTSDPWQSSAIKRPAAKPAEGGKPKKVAWKEQIPIDVAAKSETEEATWLPAGAERHAEDDEDQYSLYFTSTAEEEEEEEDEEEEEEESEEEQEEEESEEEDTETVKQKPAGSTAPKAKGKAKGKAQAPKAKGKEKSKAQGEQAGPVIQLDTTPPPAIPPSLMDMEMEFGTLV